jgi:hypothetical protein
VREIVDGAEIAAAAGPNVHLERCHDPVVVRV